MREKKWIQKALGPSSKGKLHDALGIAGDKKIPMQRLQKAEHSRNPTIRKEANLAETLKTFHHRNPKR